MMTIKPILLLVIQNWKTKYWPQKEFKRKIYFSADLTKGAQLYNISKWANWGDCDWLTGCCTEGEDTKEQKKYFRHFKMSSKWINGNLETEKNFVEAFDCIGGAQYYSLNSWPCVPTPNIFGLKCILTNTLFCNSVQEV